MNINFSFLISTSRSFLLYKNNQLQEIQNGNGVYFGISKNKFVVKPSGLPETVYGVLARNNFDGSGGGFTSSVNTLELFDSEFKPMHVNRIVLTDILDGHEIVFKDNYLYVVNSGYNLITRFKLNGQYENFTPNKIYGHDINHYNSIAYHDNKWFICQHRTKEGLNDGGISVFNDIPNGPVFDKYIPIGKHPHDILIKDGFLWSTDSFNGSVVKTDLSDTSKQVRYVINTSLLSRGLIIKNDLLFIGLSQHDIRANRHNAKDSYIYIYDINSMEKIEEITIPGYGQLNHLMLTDE